MSVKSMPAFHQEANEFLAAWEPVIQLQHAQPVTPAQSPESQSPLLQAVHHRLQDDFAVIYQQHGLQWQQQQQQRQQRYQPPHCANDMPASLPPIAAAGGPYLPHLLPPLQHVSTHIPSTIYHQYHPYVASPASPTSSECRPAMNAPQHHRYERHAAATASPAVFQECGNCRTSETSAWRKDEHGRVLCNACGLYRKQRGHDRPAAFPFRKSVVRRRNRGDRKPAPAAVLVKDVPPVR